MGYRVEESASPQDLNVLCPDFSQIPDFKGQCHLLTMGSQWNVTDGVHKLGGPVLPAVRSFMLLLLLLSGFCLLLTSSAVYSERSDSLLPSLPGSTLISPPRLHSKVVSLGCQALLLLPCTSSSWVPLSTRMKSRLLPWLLGPSSAGTWQPLGSDLTICTHFLNSIARNTPPCLHTYSFLPPGMSFLLFLT